MKTIITAALTTLITSFVILQFVDRGLHRDGGNETQSNSAYDRVMKTGVLRCGYASWEPLLIVDPATREVSGIAHDVIETAAKHLGITVEWTEEVGWGEYITALKTDRIDAFCAGGTPNAARGRESLFTTPFSFVRIGLYTGKGTTTFDNNPEAINSPSTRISMLDGTTSYKVMKAEFPNATFVDHPETVSISQVFLDVHHGKADLTMEAKFAADLYAKNNPDAIQAIKGFEDMRVMANVFMVAGDEFRLREMLNAALDEATISGEIDNIITQYEEQPNTFYRAALPHQQ